MINIETKTRIIKQVGKPYYTNKGNTYLAIPLYDKNGKKHGHVIYMKTNLVDNEKPAFCCYEPLPKFEREDEHMRMLNGEYQKYVRNGSIGIDS